jgi:hypothetical protein
MTTMDDQDHDAGPSVAFDAISPWTIKAVSKTTRDAITLAARKDGLTVGQWLDKRVAEWVSDGRPTHVEPSSPSAPSSLADLAKLMDSARSLAEAANVPVPPQLAKDGLSLLRQAVRQSRSASRLSAPLRLAKPSS